MELAECWCIGLQTWFHAFDFQLGPLPLCAYKVAIMWLKKIIPNPTTFPRDHCLRLVSNRLISTSMRCCGLKRDLKRGLGTTVHPSRPGVVVDYTVEHTDTLSN